MNYYDIIFRLSTDNRFSRRRWEGFSENRDTVVDSLVDYCRVHFFDDDLFPPQIIIIKLDEYLSIFK